MKYKGQEVDEKAVFELLIITAVVVPLYVLAISPILAGFGPFSDELRTYIGGIFIFVIWIGWLWLRGYGEFSSE